MLLKNMSTLLFYKKNKSKEKFLKTFLSKKDYPHILINLLHDSSGGFGREISQISSLGKKIAAGEIDEDGLYATGLVGYAGGIKPENVVNIIKLIENANADNKHYYVDMESGIRDNNILSLEKCRDIIDNILK